MRVHSNCKMSGQEDKDDENNNETGNNVCHVFDAKFIDFCRGAMTLYDIYSANTKYGLLESALVSVPS